MATTNLPQVVTPSEAYHFWLLMRELLGITGTAPPFDPACDYATPVNKYMRSMATEHQRLRSRQRQLEDYIFDELGAEIPEQLAG